MGDEIACLQALVTEEKTRIFKSFKGDFTKRNFNILDCSCQSEKAPKNQGFTGFLKSHFEFENGGQIPAILFAFNNKFPMPLSYCFQLPKSCFYEPF